MKAEKNKPISLFKRVKAAFGKMDQVVERYLIHFINQLEKVYP